MDAMRLLDLDVLEAGGGEMPLELVAGEGAGDATRPVLHVATGRLVHVGVGDHVGDGEPPAGPEHTGGLAKHLRLVAREVDHAVGDHDVDGVVGQRDRLDLTAQELDVLDAGLALVGAGELEHLVGHVEAVGLAARADPARGQQDVDAAARTEVEDGLAFLELRDRGRIAAAERRELGGLGQRLAIVARVEARAEDVALLVGDHGRLAAATGRIARSGIRRCRRVAVADRLLDVGVVGPVIICS